MKCKHGVEQPTSQDIRRLAAQERKIRESLSLRRDSTLLRILGKLWDRAHPCYTCYTEP